MKKIKLENLKISSFVTSLDTKNAKTIKGGEDTKVLPVCAPNDSEECHPTDTIEPYCTTNGTSLVKVCVGTHGAGDCPGNGQTAVGCSDMIC